MSSAPKASTLHWQVIGPGGGGAYFNPTISPEDPNRMLVASDMTDSYITDDAGESWRRFNLRSNTHFFEFDPHNKDVIYAQSIGLWRSDNGGHTWALIFPDPAAVQGLSLADDHATEAIRTADGAASIITALAVDPAESNILYAVCRRGSSTDFQVSDDRGKAWQVVSGVVAPAERIYVDPNSPVSDRTVYLVGHDRILIREKGSWHTEKLPNWVMRPQVSAGFGKGGGVVFYTASAAGIFVSEDRGATWHASELPGTGGKANAIAASPNNPDVAYTSFSNLREGYFSWKTFFGVARTTDRGRSWKLVRKESSQPAENVHDAWISQFFGPGWGGHPLALAVAPSNSEIVYTTDTGRVLRTQDGGEAWEQVYSRRAPDGSFVGRGMENQTSYGVHFDPFDHNRVFITYTDIGLFRSENGGRTWTSSIAGVPPKWWNTTYWMVFDPDVRGRVWAAMSSVHDLPRAKMWQRKSPSNYQGGVCISEDGGRTWRQSNDGMLPTAATHILLDPSSLPEARVLYVAGFGRGVYKSINGGKTWSLKNEGLSGNQPLAWRLARDTAGTLYLIVVRRSQDGSIGSDADGALYRSRDSAEHWSRVPLPEGVNGPNGLAIDPRNPDHLYLAAWARDVPPHGVGGGIYVSFDGGRDWRNVLSNDQHIYDVTVDPGAPNVIYAAGFESSAWRSVNSGQTWRRIAGFNFKRGHRVIPDAADPGKIYITTFGGGVWHGPAVGDSEAVDEISTPQLAHR